jgi:hypothetical protein
VSNRLRVLWGYEYAENEWQLQEISFKMREELTKIERNISEKPTCHLLWKDGVLTQLWKCEDRHVHLLNGLYQSATYHNREEWRLIPVNEPA